MENTESFRYGYLLHCIAMMKQIAEGDRGNSTEGRHRKIKKILLDPNLCKFVDEDYLSSTQSIIENEEY